jgi:hypothetical protein
MNADKYFYAWHMIFGCTPKLGKSLLQCEAPLVFLSYKVKLKHKSLTDCTGECPQIRRHKSFADCMEKIQGHKSLTDLHRIGFSAFLFSTA